MGKPHIIELEPLQEWMATHETLYAVCSEQHKKLTITCNGTFKLYHNNEVVWQGIQPFRAMENYNAINHD